MAGPNNTPILDTFNRANAANLGANWGSNPFQQPNMTGYQILNGAAVGSATLQAGNWWLPQTFGQDVEAFATISALATDTSYLLLAMVNPGSGPIGALGSYPTNFRCYRGTVDVGSYSISYVDHGGVTTLQTTSGPTAVAGNRFAFSYVGGVLACWLDNGSGWQVQGTHTLISSDPIIPQAGAIGILNTNSGTVEGWKNFGGGSVPLAQSLAPMSVSGALRT